jgi:hypothetical protein
MRIIKVIHGNVNRSIENESSIVALQNYDLKQFISNYGAEIIKRSKDIHLFTLSSIQDYASVDDKLVYEIIMKQTLSTFIPEILKEIEIVEVMPIEIAQKAFPKTQGLSIGTYTLHPCGDKRLTRLEHYHKNLAMEKDDELIKFLGKMGAKTVKIVESGSRQTTTSGKVTVNSIAADGEVGGKLLQSAEGNRELTVTFAGGPVEITPDLLKDSLWYAQDSKLNSILESRMFAPNRIETYTLRNTYTETFDFNFKLAAKYLVAEIDLQAEYESISKMERFFSVEFGKN